MRSNWALAKVYAEGGDFAGFIELAINQFQTTGDVVGTFKSCGLV